MMASPQKCVDSEEVNFREELAFLMVIKGSVNGRQFSVEGKGFGNAATGRVKGKWTCPTGKLPISWAALAGTLGFGYKYVVFLLFLLETLGCLFTCNSMVWSAIQD